MADLQSVLEDLRRGGKERWMVVQGSLVLYQPGGKATGEYRTDRRESMSGSGYQPVEGRRRSEHNTTGGEQRERRQSTTDGNRPPRTDREFPPPAEGEQTQTLTVPSDLVGCIIGRGLFSRVERYKDFPN